MRTYKQISGSLGVSSDARFGFLIDADRQAQLLATKGHPISIEDVRAQCAANGIRAPHPRMWSSVFLPSMWERVGDIKATHPGSRARRVGLWVPKKIDR